MKNKLKLEKRLEQTNENNKEKSHASEIFTLALFLVENVRFDSAQ